MTVDDVDASRAQGYGLLAHLLIRPPSAALLRQLSSVRGDPTPWGQALGELAQAAADTDPRQAEREYNRIFIGLNRGELVPYASFYLTGFLQDRPLVEVRADMARLGVARSADVVEPEDHIAALLETMAGLIDGRFGKPAQVQEQHDFFRRRLKSWAPDFFRDLTEAKSAVFYRPVGTLGGLLMEIEDNAFALVD
ncbi:molecular chaperone [Palleronia sp.]|uniref:TorD/DmsD family molecular chaperone n=1 Tax=Palleronia sp. TaxID=1940284 RepID=UPI0035C869FD